jgi:hypothetical protein
MEEAHILNLKFDDFEKPGQIRYESLDAACLAFQRYAKDEDCRRREHVTFFWITRSDSAQKVLGTPPKDWAPD